MPPTWNDGMLESWLFFNQMEHQLSQYSIIPLFSPRRRLYVFYEPEAIIPIVSEAN